MCNCTYSVCNYLTVHVTCVCACVCTFMGAHVLACVFKTYGGSGSKFSPPLPPKLNKVI